MKKLSFIALSLAFMNASSHAQSLNSLFENGEKMAVVDDTIYFNSTAYHIAEGTRLSELVRNLPGAYIDVVNGITSIQGENINKIVINGQEFFFNEVQALRYLPVENIEYIKFYERKSDLARATGINDANEDKVLDIKYKPDMERRLSGILNANHFGTIGLNLDYVKKGNRISLITNIENNEYIPLGEGNDIKQEEESKNNLNANLDFFTHAKNLEIGGSGRLTLYRERNMVDNTFGNLPKYNYQYDLHNIETLNINTNMRIEWKPSESTTLLLRPYYSYTNNSNNICEKDYVLNQDPEPFYPTYYYELDSIVRHMDNIVNSKIMNGNSSSNFTSQYGGSALFTQKFGDKGRNLTVSANGNVSIFGTQDINAYSYKNTYKNSNNLYSNHTSKSERLNAGITYTEPIAQETYLQIGYNFSYQSEKDYGFKNYLFASEAFQNLFDKIYDTPHNIDAVLDYMGSINLAPTLTSGADIYSKTKIYEHIVSLSLRKITEKYNLFAGVDFIPSTSKYEYYDSSVLTSKDHSRFNVAPYAKLKYEFSPTTELEAEYIGKPKVINPIYLFEGKLANSSIYYAGNTDLKTPFTHFFETTFRTTNPETKNSYFANVVAEIIQNNISFTDYSASGLIKRTPQSTNGNWSIELAGGASIFLDENKYFNINNSASVGFKQYKNFLTILNVNEETTTKNWEIIDNLNLSYRKGNIEAAIIGSLDYNSNRSNSTVTNFYPKETWYYTYGFEFHYKAPWDIHIHTNLAMNSRKGYQAAYETLNRDELIWNGMISKRLIDGRLIISVEAYDLLNRQSRESYAIKNWQCYHPYELTFADKQNVAIRAICRFGARHE